MTYSTDVTLNDCFLLKRKYTETNTLPIIRHGRRSKSAMFWRVPWDFVFRRHEGRQINIRRKGLFTSLGRLNLVGTLVSELGNRMHHGEEAISITRMSRQTPCPQESNRRMYLNLISTSRIDVWGEVKCSNEKVKITGSIDVGGGEFGWVRDCGGRRTLTQIIATVDNSFVDDTRSIQVVLTIWKNCRRIHGR